VWLSDSAAPAGTSAFVKLDGVNSGNILLSGNDLRGAKKSVDLSADVRPDAVSLSGNITATTA
jgi:hypothetical protein